jgi:hypothetical protein
MAFCINCGKCNKRYKYIILASICGFFVNIIFGYSDDNLKPLILINIGNQEKLTDHIIIHYIIRFFGLFLLSLFLFFYEKNNIYNTSNNQNRIKSNSAGIQFIYNDQKEEITKNASPIFVVFTLMSMVLQNLLEDLFYKSYLKNLDFWMFELLLLSILYRLILKFKSSSHHIFVIILYLIIGTGYKIALLVMSLQITDDNNINKAYEECSKNNSFIICGILFYLVIMIIRANAIPHIKVLMDGYYISPAKLMIIYGIIGTLTSLAICIISFNIKCYYFADMHICNINEGKDLYLENYSIYFEYMKENSKTLISEIIVIVLGMTMNFFYILNYLLIVKFLTPMHIIFMNLINKFFLKIYSIVYNSIVYDKNFFNLDKDYKISVLILNVVMCVIIIFGMLVYLEIIALNFCNINYNLRQNIILRSIKDYKNHTTTISSGIEVEDEKQSHSELVSTNSENLLHNNLMNNE